LISLRIPTHVLTNSQLWITHPLPLSGLACLPTTTGTSLAISWDSSSFSSDCSNRVPKRQRDEKGLKPPLVLSSCDSFFSLNQYYLANPNGGSVHNWISNNISKVHQNPTVNETGIVILLRPFWVFAGKEKATMWKVFLSAQTWCQNSQQWEISELGCQRSA